MSKYKTLSELVPGDKIYLYYISGGCSVSEIEVETVGNVNTAGYFPITFKDRRIWDIYFPEHVNYFFKRDSAIYSTIDHLDTIFKQIFEEGEENSRILIRSALGINN